MATQIIIKHSSGTTTPTLNYGELAINFKNGSEALYTKNSNNEIVAFNTWTKILGKPTTLSGYGIIDALGINSNAASATKLANTRTIWGQSFDGSENVSGAMTTVTSITMNGALSGATTGNFSSTLNVSGNTTLKGLTITNGTKSITLTVDVDGNLKLDNATSGASFYATGEVSAYGSGSTYGGGGGGSVNVLDSTALGGVYLDSDVTNTFNAYTIKSINTRLIDVEANGAMSIAFSGTGNAITNVTKSGTTLTFVKGVTVQDNLTYSTSGTTYALSAYQGYLLNRNDITAISASTSTLTLTRAAGNLTFSVPTWNQSTTGSAGSVANSLILTVTGGTTEGTNKYTFNGATAKTLNFVAGSNVSLVAAAGSVTISAIDTIYTHPTQTALSAGGTRHFITGIGVNTLGHVTGVTSSAMTKTDIDAVLTGSTSSHTHSYLPLSGGTMTGRVYMGSNDLYLNASDSGDIVFSDASNAQYARIWGNSSGLRLSGTSGTTEDVLLINGSTFTYDGNKIWHAGNDGSGSGLDADTLDGYHKPAFSQEFNYGTTAGNSGYYKIKILTTSQWMLCFTIRLYQGYKYYDIVISGYQYGVNYWYSPNAKLLSSSENTLAVNFGYDSVDNLWVAIPAGSYTGLKICNVTNGYNQVEQNWSSLFSVQNVSSLTGTIQTTVTAKRPLVYDENAVSATKLANTITIWGQNFNGEGNVSGPFMLDGIGNSQLSIYNNGSSREIQSYNGFLSLNPGGNNVLIGTRVNSAYTLDVNGTTRIFGGLHLNSEGWLNLYNLANTSRISISHNSASSKLDIYNRTTNAYANVEAGYLTVDAITMKNNQSEKFIRSNAWGGAIRLRANSGAATDRGIQLGNVNNDLVFYSRLAIDGDSGNVMIGTTTDAGYKLDVNGTFRVVGEVISNSSIATSAASAAIGYFGNIACTWGNAGGYPTLFSNTTDRWIMHINPHISYIQNGVGGYTGSLTGARVRFASDTAASTYWDLGVGVNGVGADKFSVGRSGSSFVSIDNTGNFGIGTTSPSYKLDVNGTGRFYGKLTIDNNASDGGIRVNNTSNTYTSVRFFDSVDNVGTIHVFTSSSYLFNSQKSINIDSMGAISLGHWNNPLVYANTANGFVGISNTNPQYNLDVVGTGRFSGEFTAPVGGRFGSPNSDNPNKYGLSFRSDWSATNPHAGMYFGSTSASGTHGSVIGNSAMYFTMDDTTNRGWIFRQNFTGVEQNVASISNTGNITASGEITAYSASDIRLKSDIQQLTNSLDIINKLNPVSYRWNDTAKSLNPNKNDGEDYGLIAQELEDVLPNLVHNVYDKYKSIDYVKLVPFLVAGMQEQQLEIENLKSEISGLKSEVLLLNKKIKLLQYGLE